MVQSEQGCILNNLLDNYINLNTRYWDRICKWRFMALFKLVKCLWIIYMKRFKQFFVSAEQNSQYFRTETDITSKIIFHYGTVMLATMMITCNPNQLY